MEQASWLDRFGGRVIAFRPEFIDVTRNLAAALLLSQAIYWQRHKGTGEWWWKTREEWESEIRLTPKQQRAARKRLRELKLLEESFEGVPPKTYFMVRVDRLMQALGFQCDDPDDAQEDDASPTSFKGDQREPLRVPKGNPKGYPNGNPLPSSDEITSESTASRAGHTSSTQLDGGQEPGVLVAPPCRPDDEPPVELVEANEICPPSRVVKEAAEGKPKRKIKRGGMTSRKGRRGPDPTDPRSVNEEADKDRQAHDIDGPRGEPRKKQKRGAAEPPPEHEASFKEWRDWSARGITNGKTPLLTKDWDVNDLLQFLGDLVGGFLGGPKPRSGRKAKAAAHELIDDPGPEESRKVIEWLIENWEDFATDHDINSPLPSMSLVCGFTDTIRGLMRGKRPAGKITGSHRDTGKWDNVEGVIGW